MYMTLISVLQILPCPGSTIYSIHVYSCELATANVSFKNGEYCARDKTGCKSGARSNKTYVSVNLSFVLYLNRVKIVTT